MSQFKKYIKEELAKYYINYINKNRDDEKYITTKKKIIEYLDDTDVIDKSLLSVFFLSIIKKYNLLEDKSDIRESFRDGELLTDSLINNSDIADTSHEFLMNEFCYSMYDDNMNTEDNKIILENIAYDYELNVNIFNDSPSNETIDSERVVESIFIQDYEYPFYIYIYKRLRNYLSYFVIFSIYTFINLLIGYFYYSKDYVDPELYRSIAHNFKLSKMSVGIINFNIIVCFASVSHFIEKIYRITPWWFYSIVPFYRFKNLHIISGIVVILFIFMHIIPHIINSVYLYNNNNFCTYTVLNLHKLGLSKYKNYRYIDYILTYPYVSGFVILIFIFIQYYFIARFILYKNIRHSIFFNFHWKSSLLMVILLMFHGIKQWIGVANNYIWTIIFVIYYFIDNRFRIFKTNKSQILHIVNYHDKILELTIKKPNNINLNMVGMSFLLNIPIVNKNEWHPFTIDNSSDDIIFLIEVIGNWSNKLKDNTINNSVQLFNKNIYLSRCYDNIISYIKYYNVSIVFVFGICITSFVSFLKETIKLKNMNFYSRSKIIHVIWTLNDINMIYIFKDLINEIIENEDIFNIKFDIFLTQKIDHMDKSIINYMQYKSYQKNKYDIISLLKYKIYFRRPNISNIFKNIIQYTNHNNYNKQIGLFVCGGASLDKQIKNITKEHNNNIYNIDIQYHKVQ